MRGGNRCKESAVELSIEEEVGEMTWWKESWWTRIFDGFLMKNAR